MAKSTIKGAGASESSKKFGTRTLRCTCAHAYQDKEYGAGMRVHNLNGAKAFCTVCGAKKDL